MSGMPRGLGWTLRMTLTALVLLLGVAQAQTADERAKQHFESGVAYLQESDYDNALRAFEKAHQLSKRPEILLNIATVHERTGALQKAIDALEGYLEQAPDGAHSETVKTRIENLKHRLEAQPKEEPTPAPVPAPPPPKSETAPTPTPAPPAADQPESNRVPAYVALGIGAIAAGGAVLTGVLAQGEHNDAKDNCSPRCTDDELSSGRTLALTSTILTGVAIVGAGVGAVLWFGADDAPADSAKRPQPRRFGVRIGPSSAHALWQF